jgi:sugar lactone lactonase YvrE
MIPRTVSRILLVATVGTAGCSSAGDQGPARDRPPYTLNGFDLPGPDFYPEGVAVATDGTLFAGSLGTGKVMRLRPRQDTLDELSPAGAIANAVGMVVDEGSAILWVCDGSVAAGMSSLVGLALADGRIVARHAFPAGPKTCNDVALDPAGNVYATDSASPRIVEVAATRKREDSPAEVWATDPTWAVQPGQFGLNGIIVVRGSLFVTHSQLNAIYELPIAANGASGPVRKLALDRVPNGLDGLEVAADGNLIFVEFNAQSLTHLRLDGNGNGALSVLASNLKGPTTFALFAGSAWVSEGQVAKLFDPSLGPPSLPFRVRRVPLQDGLVAP